MKYLLIIILVITGLHTNAQKSSRPIVGSFCKVYSGMEGLKITTCRLGEESKNEALIKFSGVDHPWNNKIFKASLIKTKSNSVSNNFNIEYKIDWKGKQYLVLSSNAQSPNSFTAYLIPFGSLQVEHRLGYDEGESNYTSSERLLTEYLEQK